MAALAFGPTGYVLWHEECACPHVDVLINAFEAHFRFRWLRAEVKKGKKQVNLDDLELPGAAKEESVSKAADKSEETAAPPPAQEKQAAVEPKTEAAPGPVEAAPVSTGDDLDFSDLVSHHGVCIKAQG